MATATSTTPAGVPESLVQPLEQLADALQRAVDGALVPTELPRLAANAGPLVGELIVAGCERHGWFLADAIRHLQDAAALWAQIGANPDTATTADFDDAVYQAFDCACWALTWDEPVPATFPGTTLELQAVA